MSHQRLDQLAGALAAMGADGVRLDLVQRARLFKRSWVEMANALVFVRDRSYYLDWGYEDFYAYCSTELQMRRPTVDKLTGSFVALSRHAPNVLERDGVSEKIPTCDAVDYFAKALRGEPANDGTPYVEPSDDVIAELRAAVFEEGKPVQALRRQFNPLLHPRTDARERSQVIDKAHSAVRRLTKTLGQIEGLSAARVEQVQGALLALQADLDALLAQAKQELAEEEGSDAEAAQDQAWEHVG
ncbi:MAG: hypothetical protein KC593_13390 [Myxococcales bacterium]|nr:hypothetical protein [Myxococcales bacterium]MCB9626010.1 hypothetical protein [Sandaracinaceae bacterium]